MACTRKDRIGEQERVLVSIPEKTKRRMKGSLRYKRENPKPEKIRIIKKIRKVLALPVVAPKKERGSLWSRFSNLWRK